MFRNKIRFTVIILEGDFTNIIVRKISKKYGQKQVLNDISFNAGSGECIGILGCNGSGKSTLFNILSGIISKDSGEFLTDENDLFKNRALREKTVAYVPQNPLLIEELSAKDNLLMWYEKAEIASSLRSGVLNILGINEFLKTPVKKMSGGMKKRLSIACAVSNRPKILLLDEPSSALDPVCKESLHNYIIRFKQFGGTVVLATHDSTELTLCERCYIIENGVLKEFGEKDNNSNMVTPL